LEERLSRPSTEVASTVSRITGDIVVLGASGKMGPSLARMLRRAADESGSRSRIIAVARFTSGEAERALREAQVETVRCDLADRGAVARLPDAAAVIYMAGQKFGTTASPATTWGANTVVPAIAAERYAGARIVAFSTGNVYPLSPVASGGPAESSPVGPVGEYAMSCLGRERVFEFFASTRNTPVTLIRLNYAVDLRYGVLVDIARKVQAGVPVDLRMGHANVIWQGDANAWSIRALDLASVPATVLNVTGPDVLSVRAVAERFGARFGRPPRFEGTEAPDALLSDARRATSLFGPPTVDTDTLIEWVADWIARGGVILDKPTGFEKRDGRY
jgi:nucleoside-diphosphate-sugar epimerase